MNKISLAILLMILTMIPCHGQNLSIKENYDVTVIGGGASGVCAAVQSARLGAKTLLIEDTPWLGGMLTSAGVSAIDGNYWMRSGMWGEFLDKLVLHYGSLDALKTGWVSHVQFEPSVGNDIFQTEVNKTPHLKTMMNTSLIGLHHNDNGNWNLTVKSDSIHRAIETTILIDATELGDVASKAGVPFSLGMDARSETGEAEAPDEANVFIQDMTYAITVRCYDTPHLISRPENYDPKEFCDACINPYNVDSLVRKTLWSPEMMLSYGKLPNNKFMLNWPIWGNDTFLDDIDFSPKRRKELWHKAKAKAIRYLYFMQHELGMTNISIDTTEYPTADHLPIIPYYRESRRFRGIVRFSVNDIRNPYGNNLYRTTIASGDYPIDHHHDENSEACQIERKIPIVPSFGLPLGCLIPEKEDNLILAEKCISVTHLANGSTRLQPVAMQIGQAAGTLAAMAAKRHCLPRSVSIREVQNTLLSCGTYLLPILDATPQDKDFKPLQRIAATGILRSISFNRDWRNETWMNVDSLLMTKDLSMLFNFYGMKSKTPAEHFVSMGTLMKYLKIIAKKESIHLPNNLSDYKLKKVSTISDKHVTRRQYALLVDSLLHPFERYDVDFKGELLNARK